MVGRSPDHPEPGDVVFFWRENVNSSKGHAEIFKEARFLQLAYPTARLLWFGRLIPAEKTSFADKVLKRGDTGEDVIKLQDALKILHFDCGTSDGKFGSMTEGALKEF